MQSVTKKGLKRVLFGNNAYIFDHIAAMTGFPIFIGMILGSKDIDLFLSWHILALESEHRALNLLGKYSTTNSSKYFL